MGDGYAISLPGLQLGSLFHIFNMYYFILFSILFWIKFDFESEYSIT